MSLPGCTRDDLCLVNFLIALREMVTGYCKFSSVYDLVKDMFRLFRSFGYHKRGSVHHEVVNRYWNPFTIEMLGSTEFSPPSFGKWTDDNECCVSVECYITRTLWYAYWNHRDDIKPLGDWKGVRQALVRTAVDILEAKPAVKFEKMKEIRDRFVLSFNSIDLKLHKSWVVSQNIK